MIHDDLNIALQKWVEIVGPDADGTIKNYDHRICIDELNEAQELDQTGITTAMLLQSIWDYYSSNVKVSLRDVIEENPKATRLIQLYKELDNLLHATTIDTEASQFQSKIIETLRFYGAEHAVETAKNRGILGILRRDALRSMEIFNVFQFVQGRSITTTMKYAPFVYRFDNIHSLIEATIAHGEPGVALCHILDPDGMEFSYFCFSIWNGGTLTVVTDKDDSTHPLQNQMTRCPARKLYNRWGKHHFPYELLNATFSGNAKNVSFTQKPGLIAYNTKVTRLQDVWSLESEVVIWLAMVFEQLHQRYFVENLLLPDLSYTADMMQEEMPVQSSLMLVNGWKPPIIPKFTSQDLTQNSTAENWHRESTGHNLWLEERYRDKVPNSFLNLVSDGKQLLGGPISDSTELRLFDTVRKDLKTPSLHNFGSSDQLQQDHEFIARYNQAKTINALAATEFKERSHEILEWYKEKVLANSEFLIDAACRMELMAPSKRYDGFSSEETTHDVNVIKIEYDKNGHCRIPGGYYYAYGVLIGRMTRTQHYCAINPSIRANITAVISVDNKATISLVTGIAPEDLPDMLQHYNRHEPYTGNSILDRIDPMEWALCDPWNKLDLSIKIVLSRQEFKKRRHQLLLPEFTDWDSISRRAEYQGW